MNELTPTPPLTYVSPLTGMTYEAVLDHRGYTRWEIFLVEGETRTGVQFALTKDGIAAAVNFLEAPGPYIGSRFD